MVKQRISPLSVLALTLFCAGSSACSPAEADVTCGSEAVQSPLVSGVASAAYLLLGEDQKAAVVQVDVGPADGPKTACSGVLVAPRWVLTAAHCQTGSGVDTAIVRFGPDAGAPELEIESARVQSHLDLDLLLVELPEPIGSNTIAVRPVPPTAGAPAPAWRGTRVQLAGFGADENHSLGKREFVVELVSDIGPRFLSVSGAARSGACAGDSGGPLLVRDELGSVRVAGVLSAGAASCTAVDIYTRLDLAAPWFAALLEPAPEPEPEPCGGLTLVGRCFDATAVWCNEGVLSARHCEVPESCGWSLADNGFRCVEHASDPCEGVSDLGTCDGQRALVCRDGVVESRDCAGCAPDCIVSPGTGLAACASPLH